MTPHTPTSGTMTSQITSDFLITHHALRNVLRNYKGNYCYNYSHDALSLTFNSYEKMWKFKKSEEYAVLRKFRVLTPYTKFIYFDISSL